MADDLNKVIPFNDVQDTPIDTTISTPEWSYGSVWNVAGVTSPSINAASSVFNVPVSWWSADYVWWSTDVVWTGTDYNTVSWSSWNIKKADWTLFAINAGNTWDMTVTTFIYADIWTPSATLLLTTTAANAVWIGKLAVAVANPTTDINTKAQFQAFGTIGKGIFINADSIAANSITANEISTNYLYAWTISADNITAGTITGSVLQTSATNKRVVIWTTDNDVRFYNSSDANYSSIAWWYSAWLWWAFMEVTWTMLSWLQWTHDIRPRADNTYYLWDESYWWSPYTWKWLILTGGGWVVFWDSNTLVIGQWSNCPACLSWWAWPYYIPFITAYSGSTFAPDRSVTIKIGANSYRLNVLLI